MIINHKVCNKAKLDQIIIIYLHGTGVPFVKLNYVFFS